MARSMTGFGKGSFVNEDIKLEVEIKSVNNKYLDLNIHAPRKFNAFEAHIRNLAKPYISRGKTDIYITFKEYTKGEGTLILNSALAKEYLEKLKEIGKLDGVSGSVTPRDVAGFSDVITVEDQEPDEEFMISVINSALTKALESFVAAREIEGEHLKDNILEKLDILEEIASEIEEHEPEIMEAHRLRLREKLNEVMEDTSVDESRVIAEMVIYSDKICTDEETVRLRSHIKKMRDTLNDKGSIGRNLDFLAQEMMRESNTVLSKAGDLITTDKAIELKTGIEKIREQIQNIE